MKERDSTKNDIYNSSMSERKVRHEAYKRLRNKVKSEIRKDRRSMADKRLKRGENPWHIVRDLLGDKKCGNLPIVENDQEIGSDHDKAEAMNSFFVNKVKNLQHKIEKNRKEDPIKRKVQIRANRDLSLPFVR